MSERPGVFLDGLTFWFFGTDGELDRTIDGGGTFTSIIIRIFSTCTSKARLPICRNLFFRSASEGWSMCGDSLLSTTDGGQTWRATLLPPDMRGNYEQMYMFDSQNGIAVGAGAPTFVRPTEDVAGR